MQCQALKDDSPSSLRRVAGALLNKLKKSTILKKVTGPILQGATVSTTLDNVAVEHCLVIKMRKIEVELQL